MPFNLGGPELIIILVIVLIVFGAGKLPNVMRDVGKGVKEFKKAQTEEELAAQNSQASPVVPPAAPAPAAAAAPPAPVSSVPAASNGTTARTETTSRA